MNKIESEKCPYCGKSASCWARDFWKTSHCSDHHTWHHCGVHHDVVILGERTEANPTICSCPTGSALERQEMVLRHWEMFRRLEGGKC